ncbi:MAG TPA: 6-phospho-3-hexuloisomerase [Methanomicrobiales archaeon]|jgi:6-phospho-3-hexuloisomerase|nr:6-phospho-3-hexuloisomerase [Methanomicrobiales archaeon]
MEEHPVQDMMRLMASEVRSMANGISDDEVEGLLREILNAKRVYVMGAGRSGLVARAFAMRLMHLGLTSYVVGETVTPALDRGDLVVVFSGSGETRFIADIAESAKAIGVKVCLITAKKDSRIARIADCRVVIETRVETTGNGETEFEIRQMLGRHKSFAPLGTLFETVSVIFADAVISRLMEIKGINVETLKGRHVNIE